LQEKGLPQEAVLNELQSKLREDFTHNSEKILGSTCNEPHTFAQRVYVGCLEKNLGVMPHVKLLHIENFLNDLEIVMEKLSG